MNRDNRPISRRDIGHVVANAPVSQGLLQLDLEMKFAPEFLPGQFAMLNLEHPAPLVFSRPFSILSVTDNVISFLYRIVGRGTRRLADLGPGDAVSVLGPLGEPFPVVRDDRPAVLIAGGVGLPPVLAWWRRFGRTGDLAFFGGRDGADIPWTLLDDTWHVSVDVALDIPDNRQAWTGRVTDLAHHVLADIDATPRRVLSCGPLPLLAAANDLATAKGWDCLVSMEEHMGCGYGACKGCVLPVLTPGVEASDYRNATCCQEGPVFRADQIAWPRLMANTRA